MMPFTLNVLRLMRDYNGRLWRTVLTAAFLSVDITDSRGPGEGLSYETDRMFLTGGTRV